MTRKEFIRSGGRIIFLAAMLTGTGLLVRNRRISLEGSCDDATRCASCGINSTCRDPRKRNFDKEETGPEPGQPIAGRVSSSAEHAKSINHGKKSS